jgi:hypothetical protein
MSIGRGNAALTGAAVNRHMHVDADNGETPKCPNPIETHIRAAKTDNGPIVRPLDDRAVRARRSGDRGLGGYRSRRSICCALTVLNKAIPAKKMNLSSILFFHSRRFAQVKRKNRCVAAKALSPCYWVSEHAVLLLRVKRSLRADERQFSRCKMPPACAREACV